MDPAPCPQVLVTPGTTPHHTRRACLCRSVRNGRLIGRRALRRAARSLFLMVLLDTHTPAPQCNRKNGAVVLGVRLARRTKALGVVLWPCLERSITCPVSACFLTSLLMTVWLMSKLTPIFLQDIPCSTHPNYLPSDIFRYSSLWHIKIVTLSNLLSTYENQEFAFTVLRFSNLYPIVFQPLARSRRDTQTAWNTVWISRGTCPI